MGENPTVNSRPAGRINSVDTVKGVAIVLMVFGHTAQGKQHIVIEVFPFYLQRFLQPEYLGDQCATDADNTQE